jgi:hypothetical protein
MALEEFFEKQRQQQLAYYSNYLASIRCNIEKYKKSIAFWTQGLDVDPDGLSARMIAMLSRQLEESRQDLEKYRTRIARLNGFNIIPRDHH